MAHLSELTHCFARIYSPFFRTVQADQDHASACPTLLVRNWCCSRKAEDWCFPQQVNVRQKKKEKRKRGRKNISFRADCKFRGPKSQRFLNQKVFVLSSAPFLTMLRRRPAPSWDLPCVCTLTSSSCAGRAPGRFWLSKTDLKTALLAKIRVGNVPHYSGERRETKWRFYQALFPTVADPVVMRAWVRGYTIFGQKGTFYHHDNGDAAAPARPRYLKV